MSTPKPKMKQTTTLVKDVVERTAKYPVTAPKQSNKLGFPVPKKEISTNPLSRLKSEINAENTQKLKSMTEREIQDAQAEIEESFPPELVAMLRSRGMQSSPSNTVENGQYEQNSKDQKVKSGEESIPPFILENIVNPALNIHFPRPDITKGPLDLSSPTFFQELKEKYFPTLSHDPSKLSWMKEANESNYLPDSKIEIPALRYDFNGCLLSPKVAMEVPVTDGLHHHPFPAAGYTIKELVQQSLSTVPGQRCFGLQTLGRILYRIGRNAYGQITQDIKQVTEKEGVMKAVEMALGDRHLSVHSYATEAAWLARVEHPL